MAHPIEYLKKIFKLSPERIELVSTMIVEKHMPKGSFIERSNQVIETYYIKKGAARAFYTKDGKEHTIAFAFEDEYLLTKGFAGNKPVQITITFLEDTKIIYIPSSRLKEALDNIKTEKSPEAILFFHAGLQQYLTYLEERLYVFQSMSARERYEWVINRYPRLLEYATLTQIASYLGLTKETLYRIRSGKYQ